MENRKQSVIAVRKNNEGDIIQLKLSDGMIVDYKKAQQMVQAGEIEGLNVFRGRDGDLHLRSNADGDPSNNLDNLTTF